VFWAGKMERFSSIAITASLSGRIFIYIPSVLKVESHRDYLTVWLQR